MNAHVSWVHMLRGLAVCARSVFLGEPTPVSGGVSCLAPVHGSDSSV